MKVHFPFTLACLALVASLMTAAPVYACQGPDGHPVPCQQDPGGGGGSGESTCANPLQCWYCGVPLSDGFQPCEPTSSSYACNCNYSQGVCSEYGSCEYTG